MRCFATVFATIATCVLVVDISAASPTNNVLAGRGSVGVTDGTSDRAEFVSPVALAYGHSGELLVVDQGAQRIRSVNAAGSVRTIAGGGDFDSATGTVPGGYRDGDALAARFDHPTGIAVDQRGAVYIADARNHCIRKLANGRVTTFAGAPGRVGDADGSGNRASFNDPVGVTSDGAGGLYVADLGNGLRHIGRVGDVTKVAIPGVSPFVRSVSLYSDGKRRSLFIAERSALTVYRLDTRDVTRAALRNGEGEERFGSPVAVASLGLNDVVFTDPESHSVHYFEYQPHSGPFGRGRSSSLLGDTSENASAASGVRLADGGSPFVAPVGVTVAPSGAIVVADMGNRRIRILPKVDRRRPVSGDLADIPTDDRYFRIALISNSFAYTDVDWSHSIAGHIEDRLNADRAKIGLHKPVRVVVFRLAPVDIKVSAQYVSDILSEGVVDDVVWLFNYGHIGRELENRDITFTKPSIWQPILTSIMASVTHDLLKKGVPFLVAYHPMAVESSVLESDGWRSGADLANAAALDNYYEVVKHEVLQSFEAAHVPYADLYPTFRAYERRADRVPLFGLIDSHFSRAGNALAGDAIAAELERRRPWRAMRPAVSP